MKIQAQKPALMLRPKKSKLFEALFYFYNRNLLKRRFSSLNVINFNSLRSRNSSIPLIIYGNHSSWWDGLIAFHLSRQANLDSYILMEEKQLEKLFFFRGLGAFSVVREKPRQALESINYAVDLLKEKPECTLWIFPQGEILPNDARPLRFYNGLAHIIEKLDKCFAVPIAFRYEFLGNFKPDIFVSIGDLELIEKVGSKSELSQAFSLNLTRLLDKLKSDIINQNTDDFDKLI